jgi:hypothetical protein
LDNNNDEKCVQIWQKINNCFKDNGNKYSECLYSYFIDEENNKSVSSGMIEINQLFYNIFISDFDSTSIYNNRYDINILINRLYGYEGKCIIDYKLMPKAFENYDANNEINSYVNNPLNFSPLSSGKIIFENNDVYNINLPIYFLNRFFLPKNN